MKPSKTNNSTLQKPCKKRFILNDLFIFTTGIIFSKRVVNILYDTNLLPADKI